ncbi:MAG: hypothetical protein OQK98_00390 [Gammaproteobacteria bacterium]|nr:hypothetical protein [Gammaproteobacteria bacterium]
MKIFIRQMVLGLTLITAGLMFSQVVIANEGYGSASISKINKAKKIIDFGDVKFKYDNNTIIYDLYGKKVDFDLLEEGMTAKIGVDTTQRYVGYPTLQSLHLRTVIE